MDFDGKVQYIRNKANNRPVSGKNANNSAMGLYTFPTTIDITEFENCVDENNKMIWWNTSGNNPYWMSKYNLRRQARPLPHERIAEVQSLLGSPQR